MGRLVCLYDHKPLLLPFGPQHSYALVKHHPFELPLAIQLVGTNFLTSVMSKALNSRFKSWRAPATNIPRKNNDLSL